MTLRPSHLPKTRDQVLHHLDTPASALRSNLGPRHQPGLDGLAGHLRAAGLYWIAPDMAALSVSSGARLAAARWAAADRPSQCGLAVFGGGIGSIPSGGVDIPVEAYAWGPYRGELLIWLLLSRRRLVDEMTRTGIELALEEIPPLLPVHGFTVPVGSAPVPVAGTDARVSDTLVSALAASWLLMQQPQLVDRTREQADRPVRAAYARAGRPEPEVTIVDLRRRYVPGTADPGGQEQGRRYRNRWVVSGHWRNQAHGPDRSLRRRQWVPSYVKGPDGAPLLATEKVNVWRR